MKYYTFKWLRFLFNCACVSTILTVHAAAYVDPATTSYIIQIVAGVVLACGTAAGIIWNKLRRKVKNKTNAEEPKRENTRTGNDEQGGVVSAADLLSDDDNK